MKTSRITTEDVTMSESRSSGKRILKLFLPAAVTAALALVGALIPGGRGGNLISVALAILACIPAFVLFETEKHDAREVVAIAVMSAISVLSRVIFAPIPAFKPVSAIVMITGMAFGAEAGFITGSVSALVSNFYFGQGVWTPFQMLAWGLSGLLAGLILRESRHKNKKWVLVILGICGGALFSLLMDIWTTLSFDGKFSFLRYLFYTVRSLPFTAVYCVSNVILLLILAEPLCKKTDRLREKYGIFDNDKETGE